MRLNKYNELLNIGNQTAEGLHYVLTADITANDEAPTETSKNIWTAVNPRGCFFNGNNKKITNLSIKTDDNNCAGLFSNESTANLVQNLKMRTGLKQ